MSPSQGQAFPRHHAHTRHLLSLAIANSDRWFETPNGVSAWWATLYASKNLIGQQ